MSEQAATSVPAGHEYAFGTRGVTGNADRYGGGGYKGNISFSAQKRQDMYVGLDDERMSAENTLNRYISF